MQRRAFLAAICVAPFAVRAADASLYRVGVVYRGGPYAAAIDGLRDGLKDLGLAEGKQFVFHIRAVSSDLKGVEAAAKSLEAEKVGVVYAIGTTTTLAVKRATQDVPIVFYAGADPVALGLIANYRTPGGRLTGIHSQFTDLTAKRVELLKAMLPKLRRAIVFYNPSNPVAMRGLKMARDASGRLKIELIERPVASADELRTGLGALRAGEADALFIGSDGMVISQTAMVIDAGNANRLPVMASDEASVSKGALASYGVSYYVCGRLAAKYVQRILAGTNPADLPIEQIDTPHLTINLKAAKALGLSIPESVLARADGIIR
jgi:putative tryptophan/tyrosine transport system substrate-binding protein